MMKHADWETRHDVPIMRSLYGLSFPARTRLYQTCQLGEQLKIKRQLLGYESSFWEFSDVHIKWAFIALLRGGLVFSCGIWSSIVKRRCFSCSSPIQLSRWPDEVATCWTCCRATALRPRNRIFYDYLATVFQLQGLYTTKREGKAIEMSKRYWPRA